MKKWAHVIDVKQYLSEDCSNKAVYTAATGIVNELGKLADNIPGLSHYIFEFQELADWTKELDEDDENQCDEFNYRLNKLYNWADDERIWLGL